MNRCYSLFFCFLLGFSIHANAQISDSLYKALPDTLRPKNRLVVTDKDRMRMINNSSPAFIYRFHDEFKAIDQHLEKAFETIKNNEDKMLYASAIGAFYVLTGEVSLNKYWFKKVILYGERGKGNRPTLCNAYLNVAMVDAFEEKQDSAVGLLHKAASIAIVDKDSATLRDTYYVYIAIYAKLELDQQAIAYATKYLDTFSARDKWSLSYTQTVIAKASLYSLLYRDEKKSAYADSANVLIQQVMKATKKDEAYWYQICYVLLGYQHYYGGDYLTAVKYYNLGLLPKYNQPGSYQSELIYKAKVYRNLCLIQLGKEADIKELLSIKIPSRDLRTKQELNKVLSTYYAQLGEYQKALAHYTTYKVYADSSDLVGQKGKVFEAEQKYSVVQKEAAIAQLENKNLEEKNAKRDIAIVSLIVLIILLLLYLYNRRQLTKRALEGQQLADKLQTMEKEMTLQQIRQRTESENALNAQRKSISRTMHDEVSSSVATLRFLIKDRIDHTKNKETKLVLAELEDETTEVYHQVRDFMHRLHISDSTPEYNVIDFLDNLALTFGLGSSLQVKTRYDAESIEHYFTPLHHTEVYLFIKEAVTNAMKHSGASQLFIELYAQNGRMHIEVRDNGKGLDNTGRGIGMESMQERMNVLEGEVTFGTDKGLRIQASFPIVQATVH